MTYEEWREDAHHEMVLASQHTVLTIGISYGLYGQPEFQLDGPEDSPWARAEIRAAQRWFGVIQVPYRYVEYMENGWHTVQVTGKMHAETEDETQEDNNDSLGFKDFLGFDTGAGNEPTEAK